MHIMLGKNTGQVLCNIKEYIIKYGGNAEKDYFRAFFYDDSIDGKAVFSEALPSKDDEQVFVAGLDNFYSTTLVEQRQIPSENRFEYLSSYFAELYNQQLTINNPGDSASLHVCFYLPTHKEEYWQTVRECIEAIKSIPQRYNIDLFLLSDDLAFLFETETNSLPLKYREYNKQSKETIRSIIDYNESSHRISHLILLQNCNKDGLSLNLDAESFVRIVGEYALLTVSHYDDIYNPSAYSQNRKIHALGLSVLSFDKFYFVQYLLHKAYIHILDREEVCQDEVDVNKVSPIVQKKLRDNVNIFSDFYDKNIKPRLDKGDDQDEIIAVISPILKAELAHLADFFQSFIDDDNLSLPEKKAALAQLLGEDDELLVGYMFNKDQFVIDDCAKDVLDFFIDLNNQLIALRSSTDEGGDAPSEEKSEAEAIADYASLSKDGKEPLASARSRIDALKSVKIKMRASTNYIRQKTEELGDVQGSLNEIVDSEKRLTRGGFVFGEKTYKLLKQEEEKPLGEGDYCPKSKFPEKIDLRQYFTKVKDQGALGACSAFSIVGIFEYILVRNKVDEPDLSERFVYYNVRKKNGNIEEDTGCSLHEVIESISESGVCREKCFEYNEDLVGEPSQEAYLDAERYKITKTLNVKVGLDDIRSALSEGYPVAISLKIYDSFNPDKGFISRPSVKEREGESGNHAMVICGYSDAEKIFIVRNSWGEAFGDKGYCYIPYSYIADPELLNCACIVTQISNNKLNVGGKDNKTTISFNTSDSNIKAAIIRNLISEEELNLEKLNDEYTTRSFELNFLTQALGNNATRDSIFTGSILRLEREIRLLNEMKRNKHEERTEALASFDRDTKYAVWSFWGMAVLTILSFAIMTIKSGAVDKMLFSSWSYVLYAIGAISVVLFILWRRQRKSKRVDLDQDYKSQLESISGEIGTRQRLLGNLHIKCHVASMIIDSLSKFSKNLHTKYNSMRSYVGNLRVWRTEEEEAVKTAPLNRDPFLSLISNKCLDQYFDKHKDEITQQIRLSSMFKDNYSIDEKQIIKFKNELKMRLLSCLWDKIKDFSIYKHIVGAEKYGFLDDRYTDINELLRQLDIKSDVFVRLQAMEQSTESINAHIRLLYMPSSIEGDPAKWESACRDNFQNKPNVCHSDTDDKISLLQIKGMLTEEISLLA